MLKNESFYLFCKFQQNSPIVMQLGFRSFFIFFIFHSIIFQIYSFQIAPAVGGDPVLQN